MTYRCSYQLALAMLVVSSSLAQETDSNNGTRSITSRTELIDVSLHDKEVIRGQLYLPRQNDSPVSTVVIFVHGTGPATYLNKRKMGDSTFNYFDYLGHEFNRRGVAFFSYNKRGVTIGDQPPNFDQVDREKFRKVVPENEAKDLSSIIDKLKTHPRLKSTRVILFGGSEGTVVAALAAEKFPGKVAGLFLLGYAHENMYDIIAWQYSGAASMIRLNPIFDANGDGEISRDEYESDNTVVTRQRKQLMQDTDFTILDANSDGILTGIDFGQRLQPVHNLLLYNIQRKNEDWIWLNYFRISLPWIEEHFALEPNKTRLLKLELPIFVFHGHDDAHVPYETVLDLKKRFEALNKDNLKIFLFPNHDHNLNFTNWVRNQKIPEGFRKIFEIAESLIETKK